MRHFVFPVLSRKKFNHVSMGLSGYPFSSPPSDATLLFLRPGLTRLPRQAWIRPFFLNSWAPGSHTRTARLGHMSVWGSVSLPKPLFSFQQVFLAIWIPLHFHAGFGIRWRVWTVLRLWSWLRLNIHVIEGQYSGQDIRHVSLLL